MITVQPKLILCSLILLSSTPAYSQINPDNTLGAESSRLTPNVPINGANADRIDGGAQRGSNLFHSFSEFNINNGQRVYFGNPVGVQNILTRVTGGQGSNILGTLGVDGIANLFLINPNGILFGQNARLDIRGAFTATTANSLIFPNGVEFSATNPQAPPLLVINVPIGLQFGSQPGSITSQAVSRNSQGNAVGGLGVGSGSTLALMGGEIAVDGSFLFASNGQVKLGAVGGDTTVGLNVNGSTLSFQFPKNVGRAGINLTNGSFIATTGNNPIELFGGQISLNGSSISGQNGGSVVVDATQLSLNGSLIESFTTGVAKGGDIQIQASDAVNLANGSLISSSSNASATGAGGDITINARKITIAGDGTATNSSSISTGSSGKGNGGNLTFNAKESVNVNGGFIFVSTYGEAKGGNLTVQATDAVNITNSAWFALFAFGSGSTGNLRIETGTLRVQSNSLERGVAAVSSGGGSIGSISIQARNAVEVTQSRIFTNIAIPPGTKTSATVGDITIETQRVSLKDGGSITTLTSSSANAANAANIFIKASEYVEISGISYVVINGISGVFLSGVSSQTGHGATGNSGNVTIETPRLSITQGGQIDVSSIQGSGKPGNITIRAQDVELDGFFLGSESLFKPTEISSDVIQSEADETKPGVRDGTITIDTERLRLSNGAKISTSVGQGRGQGGNLVVRASDYIDITGVGPIQPKGVIGSGLFAELQTGGIGEGGSISVETGRLNLNNGGKISALSVNQGKAGSIAIRADQINLRGQNSRITTQTQVEGDAGDISISTQKLNVQDGAQIDSSTFGNGNAGNLTVQAADTIELAGSESGLFSAVYPRANGKGGNLSITTGRFIIRDDAGVYSSSVGKGDAGNIKIRANLLEVGDQGSGLFSSTNAGNGGDISLNIGDLLLLRRGAFISTTAGRKQAGGDGGNITINSPFIVAVPNENSDIRANAFSGKGGNVSISTQAIFGIEPRPQPTNQSDITASSELGLQGQITITQPQVQPPQKLIELPTGLIDATTKFAQTCPRGPNAKPLSSFVVTGRGSLPPNFFEPLTGTTSLSPLASLDGEGFNNVSNASPTVNLPATSQIVEAQGLVKTADGTMMLVAEASTATPAATRSSAMCPGS